MHTTFHRKARFKILKIHTRVPRDLDLYLVVNQRQMKLIDAYYNVRVGYWASINNVQEY